MKKLLPYILILIVLVGVFSPLSSAHAQTDPMGTCDFGNGTPSDQSTQSGCVANGGTWTAPTDTSEFKNQVDTATVCWDGGLTGSLNIPGCLVKIFYYIFYSLPALLLSVAAKFFNAIVNITIDSRLYTKSTFIPTAWAVVRDLSNLFFILILLYVAIEMILGLGGSNAKKTIITVIITALLINFSMFFTEVVIDSSNAIALVFYNKMDVSSVNSDGTPRPYTGSTGVGEKDISGGMVNAFDPTSNLTWTNFFAQARTPLKGVKNPSTGESLDKNGYLTTVPPSLMLGIIFISGIIMLFATYAFFIAGISFVSRLIELWVVIIFSPFAFMSVSIPILEKVDYIGWDAWLKRLLNVSFMAPIFMFFMYFIFLMINAKIFGGLITTTGMIETLLLFIIPAMVILILLIKATDFAKKGAGKLGEMLIKGTEIAMGAVAGVGAGLGAVALQSKVGSKAAMLADSEWVKTHGKIGRGIGNVSEYLAGSSFDLRKGVIGGGLKALGGISGINLGHDSTLFKERGGYRADREKFEKKERARADRLKVSEDEKLKQELNGTEADLQSLLNANALELSNLDKLIDDKRKALADANAQFGAGTTESLKAGRDLENAKNRKASLRNGTMYTGDVDLTTGAATAINAKDYSSNIAAGSYTYMDANGVSQTVNRTIKNLETLELVNRKQAIENEDRARMWAYAKDLKKNDSFIGSRWKTAFKEFGFYAGNNIESRSSAAHKIIMNSKIESTK